MFFSSKPSKNLPTSGKKSGWASWAAGSGKHLEDRDDLGELAAFGSVVLGIDEGDGRLGGSSQVTLGKWGSNGSFFFL